MKQHGSPKKRACKKQFFYPAFTQSQRNELNKFANDRHAISLLWNGRQKVKARHGTLKLLGFVFGGKKGKGEKKAMIVQSFGPIVYYPKPSEALRFILAARDLEPGGTASIFPGSVGVMSYCSTGSKTLKVHLLQSNFSNRKGDIISRSAFSKHGGWRQHVLDYFFRRAIIDGVKTVSFLPRSEIQEKIFVEIAEKNGFETKKRGNSVIAEVQCPKK